MSESEVSGQRSAARSWAINLGLLAVAAVIVVVCMSLGAGDGSEEAFVGTDTAAVASIEESHPDYRPWFGQLFAPPSAEVESGLFALQAALGAGVFGYALGALRRKRTTPVVAAETGDPHS